MVRKRNGENIGPFTLEEFIGILKEKIRVRVRSFDPGGVSTTKDIRVNGQIRAREVRLIDADGGQLGVVSLNEALKGCGRQRARPCGSSAKCYSPCL